MRNVATGWRRFGPLCGCFYRVETVRSGGGGGVGCVCACFAAGCDGVWSVVLKKVTGMIRGAGWILIGPFCGCENVF